MQDKIKTDFGISINDDCMNVIKNMPSNYVDMVLTDRHMALIIKVILENKK